MARLQRSLFEIRYVLLHRSSDTAHSADSNIGDMTYLQVMGRRVVVLGNAAVISELLDKRASTTSDRLVTPIVHLYVTHFLDMSWSH